MDKIKMTAKVVRQDEIAYEIYSLIISAKEIAEIAKP